MAKKRSGRLLMGLLCLSVVFAFCVWELFQAGKSTTFQKEGVNQTNGISTSTSQSPGIYSSNAVLMDLSNGRVLYQKAGDEKAYPASLTKIMTVIVAIEHLPDLQASVTLSNRVFRDLREMDASTAGFFPNERLKIADLLYGAMLPSGADAAQGLAIAVSGSEAAFVKLMNQKAAGLGMRNTHFANDSGLQDADHYTTARDIAILLKYALKNHTFRELFTAHRHIIPPTNLHPDGMTLYSTLFQEMTHPEFDGISVTGGKTGYTEEAGLCLATLARKDHREYILVTMGARGNHQTLQFNVLDASMIYKKFLE
ncbi:D-alanyl-D-alanine carboxypeptidase family protein [Sporolactobacillus pectinivorans]|uniref:D-alanyl-D-alanine carboxypeptidase family protein n=1 Tax=Sporolactobacillus pectinivorans TaxID=1591408 RepID=UPI000C265234|nr:serine hydrolase [Sporolactobacillus pectinivorans]